MYKLVYDKGLVAQVSCGSSYFIKCKYMHRYHDLMNREQVPGHQLRVHRVSVLAVQFYIHPVGLERQGRLVQENQRKQHQLDVKTVPHVLKVSLEILQHPEPNLFDHVTKHEQNYEYSDRRVRETIMHLEFFHIRLIEQETRLLNIRLIGR